eukprot:4943794-Ditylum_brightwellii.AAC.1
MRIAEFCLKVNREMTNSLCDVLDDMLSIYSLRGEVLDRKWKTTVSTKSNDVRRMIMDRKFSMKQNSSQMDSKIVDKHAHFSLENLMELTLGLGYDFCELPPYDGNSIWYKSDSITELSQSEMDLAKKLSKQTEDDCIKIHLTASLWSDDFDPSTSNK